MKLLEDNKTNSTEVSLTNYGKSCRNAKVSVSPIFMALYVIMLFTLISCRKEKEKEEVFSEFNKTYGGSGVDAVYDLAKSRDGGYVAVGSSRSINGSGAGKPSLEDAWIFKIDKIGNKVWEKLFGGSNTDIAFSIISTSDGGYLMAGNTSSTDGDVSGNHGGQDVWLVKLNESGSLLWQKTLGGSGLDRLAPNSIIPTSDGGYIMVVTSSSSDGDVSGNKGKSDIWLVKVNANGNIIWRNTLGGSEDDFAGSITATTDGNYFLTGNTYSNDGNVSGNKGRGDAWLVKVSGNGNIMWQKTLGGTNYDSGNLIRMTGDGGYIMVGGTYSNDGDVSGYHGNLGADIWVVKLDASRNIRWQKTLGSSQSETALSLVVTPNDGFIIGGFTGGIDGDVRGNHGGTDGWLVEINSSGALVEQKAIGGSDEEVFFSILPVSGGYLLGGWTTSNDGDVSGNHGSYDGWIIKTRSLF